MGDKRPDRDAPGSVEPRPLGGLADLAELVGGDDERPGRFMGGLVAGALVGAAIAGSVLLRRRTPRGPEVSGRG